MISYIIRPGIQKPWIILAGSSFGIVVLSFIRFAYTGVLTVDFIKFQGWPSYLAGLGFVALLCIFGYGYYRVVMNDEGWAMNQREVTVLSLWMAFVATLMLPMLSNDIFGVLAYGDLVLKGISPYDSGYNLLQSDFFNSVGPRWKSTPCVYGPVSLAISAAAVSIGGTHDLIEPIMIYKVLNAVFVIIFILLVSQLDGNGNSRFNAHALVLLSPILWLQGSGQGHNDMIAAAFIAVALMSAMKMRYALSAVLAALAFNAKLSGVIVCPLLVLLLWDSYKETPWLFAAKALQCIGIFVFVTVIVWLPFYTGSQSIMEPLTFLNSKTRPVIQEGCRNFFSILLNGYDSIDRSMTGADKKTLLKHIQLIMRRALIVLFLTAVIFNTWKYIRKTSSSQTYITLFAILGTAFLTISANAFHPWYMLIILPFFLYLDDRKWVVWVILVSIPIHFIDIPALLQKSHFSQGLYKTSLVVIAGLFLWRIRSRYFTYKKVW